MNEQSIKFIKRNIKLDHLATVSRDGFNFYSEEIITPKGLKKENTLISVIPESHETVFSCNDVPYLFSDIGHMNVILTNACNLSCSYCYEQHNKDFGRFTKESLLQAYNWLLEKSQLKYKRFQFFGGEPLIHKDLIISFLQSYHQYLSDNYYNNGQSVTMITNGLLLDKNFCTLYFDYDFTYMLISLDTLRHEIDHRELSQDDIDKIINIVSELPAYAKDRITFRCTLTQEGAPYFVEYIDKLHSIGINNIIVHPLVHNSSIGYISWNDNIWNGLHKDIVNLLDKYVDLNISFSEGVGQKITNNCLIGSDMIAIDASGDFSGCYFFTNMKANDVIKPTILGNIFENNVYIDRYNTFRSLYLIMYNTEDQCKACNYKNYCYQCPAGNASTGTPLFRPDDMCQKIVKLYLDLQDDIKKKHSERSYRKLSQSL